MIKGEPIVILLVEDNEPVREFAMMQLVDLG